MFQPSMEKKKKWKINFVWVVALEVITDKTRYLFIMLNISQTSDFNTQHTGSRIYKATIPATSLQVFKQ